MCQEEKISIVIPAFNCEKTIGRCLDSALAQTWPNTEIIAVDDGSTDQTGSILDTYQKEHGNIRVIHQENSGVAAARNAGIKAAEGIWLVTLDADDYIDPEMLKAMHDAAAAADAQLCICGFRMVYEEDKRKEVRQLAEDFEGDLAELLNTVLLPLYDRQLLNNQNNKLYRLDLIREQKIFYDPAMQINEDLWFSLTYLRYCREIAVLKRPFLNYTQHKEGESLVSRFHENAVETSFAVLRACDALLDGRDVTDEVINGMNNRMLFNICGYAGWQYYKTNYPEEKLLENIRQLCQREDLQKLLEQTDPLGLKNRIAHALLKKKKAEAYHRLCMLLYRKKRKQLPEAAAEAVAAAEAAAPAPEEKPVAEQAQERSEEVAPAEAQDAEAAVPAPEMAASEATAPETEGSKDETSGSEEVSAPEVVLAAEDEPVAAVSEAEPEEEPKTEPEEEAPEAAEAEVEAKSEEEKVAESEEATELEPEEVSKSGAEPELEEEEPEEQPVSEGPEEENPEETGAEPEEPEAEPEEEAEPEPDFDEDTVPWDEEPLEEEDGQQRLPEEIVPRSPEPEERKVEIREITPPEEPQPEELLEEAGMDVPEALEEEGEPYLEGTLEEEASEEGTALAREKAAREERRRRRRRMARRPRDPEMIEGQIEIWDILRSNGTLDGVTDDELAEITKKLENSL